MNDFVKGEKVKFMYDGKEYTGEIYSVYGDTVNVVWDDKHTAFFYKSVARTGGV